MTGGFCTNLFLISIISCTAFLAADVFGQQLQAVTERGNVFVLDMPEYWKEAAGNKTSATDGIGVVSRLVYDGQAGQFVQGTGSRAEFGSLVPYNHVDADSRFASAIDFSDGGSKMGIPEFFESYRAVGSSLQKDSSNPSTLGYSASRTLSGNIGVTRATSDGIDISGHGRLVLKLNSYSEMVRIDGTLAGGSTLRIVDSPYDLTTQAYDSDMGAYLISHTHTDPGPDTMSVPAGSVPDSRKSGTFDYDQEASAVVYHGKCCKSRYVTSGTIHQSVIPNLQITSHNAGYLEVTGDTTIPELMDIDSITRPGAKILRVEYNRVANFDHRTYDTLPAKLVASFPRNFEAVVSLDAHNRYVVIDSSGGESSISGRTVGSSPNPALISVSGLEPDTVFRIVGDGGRTMAAGATDSGGAIEIRTSASDRRTFESIGGYLQVYPDVKTCRIVSGQNCVFDHRNSEIFHIPSGRLPHDTAYGVHAYAKIPVTGQGVTVSDTSLDGSLMLPHIDGTYGNGDSLYVPIVPTYGTIRMNVNDIPVSLAVEDLLGGGSVRISDTASNTIQTGNPAGFTDAIDATVGTLSFAVASTDGTLKAYVQATVSGESEITNTRHFYRTPPPPPPPQPLDPLSAWVDVYVNGRLTPIDGHQSTQIFFSDRPVENHGSGVGTFHSWHTARFEYPEVTVIDTMSIPVRAGDFVEVYFYTKIEAQGSIPPTVPDITTTARSSSASATVTLEHAGLSIST